jgi:hypothetical protein
MVLGMVTRTRGAKKYRILKGSSELTTSTIGRKSGVRDDPARLSSHLHLHCDGYLCPRLLKLSRLSVTSFGVGCSGGPQGMV